MSVLRSERPSVAPAPHGPRAKALRPFEVRETTRAALVAYERAAKDYESMRLAGELDVLPLAVRASSGMSEASASILASLRAVGSDGRFLRIAAAALMSALSRECELGSLPRALASDLERWQEGEFAGTDVDVEVANHAIHALLGSEVCAELTDSA